MKTFSTLKGGSLSLYSSHEKAFIGSDDKKAIKSQNLCGDFLILLLWKKRQATNKEVFSQKKSSTQRLSEIVFFPFPKFLIDTKEK